jgi:prepilin-type N-terminal cleavage/methylation domain-containing protein
MSFSSLREAPRLRGFLLPNRPFQPASPERRAGRSGFTLLEIVLSMAILLVGLTAVLGFLTFGSALARTALQRGASAQAVEAVVADLEETLFPLAPLTEGGVAGGAAGEPEPVRDRPVPGFPGLVYSADVRPDPNPEPGRPREYRVDVELGWSAAGDRRSRRFTTLLLGEVPFGERMRRTFVEGTASSGVPEESDR